MDIEQNQVPHMISIIRLLFFFNLSYQRKVTKKLLEGHFPHNARRKGTAHARDRTSAIETRGTTHGNEAGL